MPLLDQSTAVIVDACWTEHAAREQAVKRLRAKHDQIEARIEIMYMDKLDGRITQEFFDRNSATWRNEQQAILQKIRKIQVAAPLPIDHAVDMLRLTSRASELFLQQPAPEQRTSSAS